MPGSDRNQTPSAKPRTALQGYWDRVAQAYAAADPLAAVCYPGAPAWLNGFIAGLQWRAVTGALGRLPINGQTALDVGCGVGRWAMWLAGQGARVVGVDATEAMLQVARTVSPGIDFRQMSVTALQLPDAGFDLVVCITVIQHLPPAEQLVAVSELCRVTRPGGHVVVLDLIDALDAGKVVHPRPPQAWIDCYARNGAALVGWRGQEYVPLLRVFRRLAEAAARLARLDHTGAAVAGPSLLERTHERGIFRLAFGVLWAVVQLSRPLEFVCERVLPDRWARHGCFIFRKQGTSREPIAPLA